MPRLCSDFGFAGGPRSETAICPAVLQRTQNVFCKRLTSIEADQHRTAVVIANSTSWFNCFTHTVPVPQPTRSTVKSSTTPLFRQHAERYGAIVDGRAFKIMCIPLLYVYADNVTPIGEAAHECVCDEALSHLKSYKYSSVDRSLLSYYVLNPYVHISSKGSQISKTKRYNSGQLSSS